MTNLHVVAEATGIKVRSLFHRKSLISLTNTTVRDNQGHLKHHLRLVWIYTQADLYEPAKVKLADVVPSVLSLTCKREWCKPVMESLSHISAVYSLESRTQFVQVPALAHCVHSN